MTMKQTIDSAALLSPEGKAAQQSLSNGDDMESAARAALAAIERDARERAAPYLAHLAHVASLTPPASLVIDPNAPAFVQGLGYVQMPRPSRASQVRAAILEAWNSEGDTARHMIAALVRAAPDPVLERLARLLK